MGKLGDFQKNILPKLPKDDKYYTQNSPNQETRPFRSQVLRNGIRKKEKGGLSGSYTINNRY